MLMYSLLQEYKIKKIQHKIEKMEKDAKSLWKMGYSVQHYEEEIQNMKRKLEGLIDGRC